MSVSECEQGLWCGQRVAGGCCRGGRVAAAVTSPSRGQQVGPGALCWGEDVLPNTSHKAYSALLQKLT